MSEKMDLGQWEFGANDENHLVIGGCDSIRLAEELGTPLHVVDEEKLRRNYRNFYDAFAAFSPNVEVYYSYKTNCIPGVLKILHEEGAGGEVISPYELWLSLKLGVEPNKIIYNGVDKSEEVLKTAIENEIKLININSISEIEKVEKIANEVGKKANIGIRVCTNIGWKGPFGVNVKTGEAFHAFERVSNKKNLVIRGMHSHIGTLIKEPSTYVRNIEEMLKLSKQLKERLDIDIEYLDLGGGFGISTVKEFNLIEKIFHRLGGPTRPPKPNSCAPIERFAEECTHSVRNQCRKFGLREPILLLEPGRFITSSPQILLLRVNIIKETNKRTKIAVTDGGQASITSPTGFEYHEVFVANKINAKIEERYDIVGRATTLSDWTYKNKKLPKLKEGDILAIMDAGAYFTTFSNNFAFPRPAIAIASKGRCRVIRRRETFEYMSGMDELLSSEEEDMISQF